MDRCDGDDTTEIFAQKKDEVTEKLKKRDDLRLAEVQKRKEREGLRKAKYETIDFFESMFVKAQQKLVARLEELAGENSVQTVEQFDVLFQDLNRMRKFFADSTYFLPQRNIMKAQESLLALQNSLNKRKDELFPKKKFTFASKKKVSESTPASVEKPDAGTKATIVGSSTCGVINLFSNEDSKTLSKSDDDIKHKDLAVTALNKCTVVLQGNPAALHATNLTDCKVLCGPVNGSIFVDNCVNCLFVLACQQLRIHKTIECQFYIHVTSKAIIEDSKLLNFAPYNWKYGNIDADYASSQLNQNVNNWDAVDDFNWLAVDHPSPNWSVLPEDDRLSADDMQQLLEI